MDGFFSPLQNFPEYSGFNIGSPLHFAYLTYCAVLIVFLVMLYRHLPADSTKHGARQKMLVIVSCCALGMKAIEAVIAIVEGVYYVAWWPLHSCDICLFLLVIYAFAHTDFVGEVLYCLGLPGALMGLVFADWIKRSPDLNFFCICDFSEHALVVAFVLMLIVSGDFTPKLKSMWKPLVFTVVCASAARIFNGYFETNFWFVSNPSPGSPLVDLANMFGNPGYLAPFAFLVVCVWLCMYLPWEIARRRR